MKKIIYQMLPRYWGNSDGANVKYGSLAENGCGTFADVDEATLEYIHWLGCTHVWYTGILHHASSDSVPAHDGRPASAFVKGLAGSPYAVENYYETAPYLGSLEDFKELICRTHKAGLRCLIDFIPNHVAPNYHDDFGGIPDCGRCDYDWTDTVKIDYNHPATWGALYSILRHWALLGVDGFRCDMVELVPCEFFQWAIARLKSEFPGLEFVAEVYNKDNYWKYIREVGFDLLYDKSGLYDILHALICRHSSHCENDPAAWDASARSITWNWQRLGELEGSMLNFLENHDEKRIASPAFAGKASYGLAGAGVSALFNHGAFMLYAGQEMGERGLEDAGQSGPDGRSTIYDFWSADSLAKLKAIIHTGAYKSLGINEIATETSEAGRGSVSFREAELFCRYAMLLQLSSSLSGDSFDLGYCQGWEFDPDLMFAFLNDSHLVVCNFSHRKRHVHINIPAEASDYYGKKIDGEVFVTIPAFDFSVKELG